MKKLFIYLFVIVFLLGVVSASNCPPEGPPKVYSGSVFVNGALLTGTYTLNAVMGNINVGQVIFSNGVYNDLQISPCAGTTGEIIFAIHGIEANEKGFHLGEYKEWGEKVVLDLTLNQIPPTSSTCGNSVIELGEECDGANLAGRSVNSCGEGWEGTISCSSTCIIDYSQCIPVQKTSSTTTSSSSGSSGGASSGSGGGGAAPSTTSLSDSTNQITGLGSESDSEQSSTGSESLADTKKGINWLTGAIIGSFGNANYLVLWTLVILIVAALVVFFATKEKIKK